MPSWLTWLKPLLDILLLILPGGSEARQIVVIGEDLYPVALNVQAWIVSPQGQAVLADIEKLAKGSGQAFSAAAVTARAKAWSLSPAPAEVGGRPSGTNHGGLMWPPSG